VSNIPTFFVYAFYFSLWTYVFPDLRIMGLPYGVAIAALAVIAISAAEGPRIGKLRLCLPLLLASATLSVSYIWSVGQGDNLDHTIAFKALAFGLFPLAISSILREPEQFTMALKGLLFSSVVALGYGVYGYFSQATGIPSEHQMGYFGISYTPSTRNTDAYYLLSGLCIVLPVFMARSRQLYVLAKAMAAGLVIVFTITIALTFSRGAWITGAIALASLLFLQRRRPGSTPGHRTKNRALITVAFFAMFAVVLARVSREDQRNMLSDRADTVLSTSNTSSNSERIDILHKTWMSIQEHPILGTGIGNLRQFYRSYGMESNHAENGYFQVLAEEGVVGFAGIVVLMVWTFRIIFLRCIYDSGSNPLLWMILLAQMVAVCFYMLFNLLLDNMWFWAVFSLCCAAANRFGNPAILLHSAQLRHS
jgi:O-antigen ligase